MSKKITLGIFLAISIIILIIMITFMKLTLGVWSYSMIISWSILILVLGVLFVLSLFEKDDPKFKEAMEVLAWVGFAITIISLILGLVFLSLENSRTELLPKKEADNEITATLTQEKETETTVVLLEETVVETTENKTIETNLNTTDTDKTVYAELNLYEELIGTLDDFGGKINYTDRFAINGTILDESLNEGEIIVGNAFSIHDNDFISQDGNVLFYYIAPENGGRVRLTGFDGQFFVFNKNSIELNQSIAAMRKTLIDAHGATNETIEFHELVRYGDNVN